MGVFIMKENNGKYYCMHIVSLVLGIISIFTSLFWYITLPTGIIAIIFGVKSIRKFGSKMGIAGLVTGIIGLVLFAFLYITMIFIAIVSNL